MISNSLKMMVDANTAPVINSLSVTKNGTYTAPEGVDGYSPITVDVQEEPWEPLEDGYSNFWFELSEDTLSPWLNFSAKNENAVIDWGDGSGEQALTTLTPTHTYAKAGRYIVKVKGVTGIAAQHLNQLNDGYFDVLQYVELNNEVVNYDINALSYCTKLKKVVANLIMYPASAFRYCAELESVIANTASGNIGATAFQNDMNLREITVPNNCGVLGASAVSYSFALKNIVLPSTTTELGASCFNACINLFEIHIQATTPPTIGVNVFYALPNTFIVYVPVGYGDTYKAASGWSSYADHILEEGQTPTRAMLFKFNDKSDDKSDTPEER